eukprot:TRINITY_DN2921_c0_g1_i3.p1 TRINITY_DN2921_c0_g1~~TRINITY_DN2921_c0_g1_i3.p1  ORF type:complete len:436 (-),score=85.95 TRINITY_DN2921_c0_g1_i3:103-1410(-)
MKKDKRFIDNTYSEYVDGGIEVDEKALTVNLERNLTDTLMSLYKKCPPTCEHCEKSTGEKSVDITMYTGTCGNIYLQWRLYELYKSLSNQPKAKGHLADALEAFEVNQRLYSVYNKSQDKKRLSPSFYMGEPGLDTLGAILFRELGDVKKADWHFKKVVENLKVCNSPYAENEVLYGNAGYLYCLLLLYKTDPIRFECKKAIIEVVNLLKKSREETSNGAIVLDCRFPKAKGRHYLGAAHGISGVVYMLLKAIEMVEELSKDKELMALLESTCDRLLTVMNKVGNFPVIFGSGSDNLYHFCHGAPGIISSLLEAHKILKKENYISAALLAGEAMWKHGIILKGNTLCHGITGNTYFLHTLYRYTSNPLWYYRFTCFLNATWNETIQQQVLKHSDPLRKVVGTPDSPYSLMEGKCGTAVLYADALSKKMLFPGFEL